MDRRNVDRLSATGSDRILSRLTTLQHLRPAWPARRAVALISDDEGLGLPPEALDKLAEGHQALGRMKRCDICMLAQRIETEWQRRVSTLLPSNSNL